MSSLVHLPCRKGPTEGPLGQWSPGLPVERECRDWPVPCFGGGHREVGSLSGQPPPAHDPVWPFLGSRWDIPTQQPLAVPEGNPGAIL